jgi:hypothetical protein
MNPRIQLLAEQAGSTHKQNLGVYQFYADELEKFAQLIVRECIGVIEDSEGYSQYFPHVTENIEKHFGVKE